LEHRPDLLESADLSQKDLADLQDLGYTPSNSSQPLSKD
jgi:hypothetical protein